MSDLLFPLPCILFGWTIYAVVLSPDAGPASVAFLFRTLSLTSMLVLVGYAVLFSSAPIAQGYVRLKRVFDLTFGVLFGVASLKLLTTKHTP
ncbi:MAG: hypothetical protein KIH44_003900 [Octadecabacter sp.]|nr:hypothetical protein [Octadecabacter sp.]